MIVTGVHDLGLFVATVFVLNATPGVDMMLTASRTLQHGVRGGLATALGISTGCVVHAVAAAFGLAALLAASSQAFTALKWIGAAYLLWLGVGMLRAAWRRDATAAVAAATTASPAPAALFRQGLLTNVLNPKIALFFLALLPQFIAADAPSKTGAFLALGALMALQGALFLVLFVLLVARARRLRTHPAARRVLQGAGGFALLVLSARLAFAPRP